MALRTYTHPQGLTKQIDSADTDTIAVAERKGYIYQPPTPPSAAEVEQSRQSAISAAAQTRVDAVTGGLTIDRIVQRLVRGLKRVRKESKRQANAAEVAELDALEAMADATEAIRDEETRLLSDTNLSIADANWPT